MKLTPTAHHLGILYMTAAFFAWRTGGVFARYATTDLITTMFWRNLFSGAGLGIALLGALETPMAPLWVWLLGETPGLATAIGGSVAMGAVIWHTVKSAPPA